MLLLLGLISTFQYKIKLFDTEKYLRNNMEMGNIVVLDDSVLADTFITFWDDNKAIRKWLYPIKYDGKTLDYDFTKKMLCYSDLKKDDSQAFEIVPVDIYDRTFLLVKDGLCLTWKEDLKKFNLEICYANEKNQHYEFIAQNYDYTKLINIDKDLIVTQPVIMDIVEPKAEVVHVPNTIEKENHSLLQGIYRSLYDLTLCLGNTGVCSAEDSITAFQSAKSSSSSRSMSSSSSRSASSSASSRSSSARSGSAKSGSSSYGRKS